VNDPETPAGPETLAGQELLRRHPDLDAEEVAEVERQARGQEVHAGRERGQRVADGLRHLLTTEQLGAVTAVLLLDPETIGRLDDATLRSVLYGLTYLFPDPGPEARAASKAASDRFLNEIM
jgi:hypothetical protein